MNRAPDCDTCQAWDEHANMPGLGYCRRHAPAAQHVSEDDGGIILTIWPETEAKGDGCFDHVAMPYSTQEQRDKLREAFLGTRPGPLMVLPEPGLMRTAGAQPMGTEWRDGNDVRDAS